MEEYTMKNTVLVYNNMLDFELRTVVDNVEDLYMNMQILKQFQSKINQIQELKDDAQFQMNTIAVSLLRKYILSVPIVGVELLRKLIQYYYPLNDVQIMKYETMCPSNLKYYYISNINVQKRKGDSFSLEDRNYAVRPPVEVTRRKLEPLKSFASECTYPMSCSSYQYSYKIDFHKDDRLEDIRAANCDYQNSLMKNVYVEWDWELVSKIKRGKPEYGLKVLLDNEGFIAQMGIDNIEDTIHKLQELMDNKSSSLFEKKIEMYNACKSKLYSYLPIPKEYIMNHIAELDLNVLQSNPRIQWDLELINVFLKRYVDSKNEQEYWGIEGSHAMYSSIECLLNDDVLDDIEKLYTL